MTVFDDLRKKHRLRRVSTKNGAFRKKPIADQDFLKRVLAHWHQHQAHAHAWPHQQWYRGIGLHYSTGCMIQPLTKQLCGNDGRDDYEDSLLYDQEIFPGLIPIQDFSLVRSTITCLSGSMIPSGPISQENWHHDESPFEILRIIIPLQSHPVYFFQLDNHDPVFLEPGYAYAFDQSLYHRVYSTASGECDRVHLILSMVPWFQKINGEWSTNAFFNRVHPLDLFEMTEL